MSNIISLLVTASPKRQHEKMAEELVPALDIGRACLENTLGKIPSLVFITFVVC